MQEVTKKNSTLHLTSITQQNFKKIFTNFKKQKNGRNKKILGIVWLALATVVAYLGLTVLGIPKITSVNKKTWFSEHHRFYFNAYCGRWISNISVGIL